MANKTKEYKDLKHFIEKETLPITYVFLGVGLTVLIMNLSGILNFPANSYSFNFFNLSTFASILIIVFAVYKISSEK